MSPATDLTVASLGYRFELEMTKDGAGMRQILNDLGCSGKEWEL